MNEWFFRSQFPFLYDARNGARRARVMGSLDESQTQYPCFENDHGC